MCTVCESKGFIKAFRQTRNNPSGFVVSVPCHACSPEEPKKKPRLGSDLPQTPRITRPTHVFKTFNDALEAIARLEDENETLRQYVNSQPAIGE